MDSMGTLVGMAGLPLVIDDGKNLGWVGGQWMSLVAKQSNARLGSTTFEGFNMTSAMVFCKARAV